MCEERKPIEYCVSKKGLKVTLCESVPLLFCSIAAQSDQKMNDIMTLAHAFLQNFCRGNTQNQILLHKHLNLFLTPGVRTSPNLHPVT